MGQALDLDARRAERSGKPKELKLQGARYHLPPSIPLLFGEYLTQGRFRDALALLVPEEQVEGLAGALDLDDLTDIVTELYGVELPESVASSPSSKTTGGPSRQTSKRTTG